MLKIEKGGKKGANFPRTVYLPFLFSSYLIAVLYALNSKALTIIEATYDSITIPSTGYISLQKENLKLDNVKMATIYFYKSIEPEAAITVYGDYKGGYLFGTPGTTVKDLRVRFWKFTK